MKFKAQNLEFDIPVPSADDLVFEGVQYVPATYAPAKVGEIVYSIIYGKVMRRETDSKSPYWILRRVGLEKQNVSEAFERSFDAIP